MRQLVLLTGAILLVCAAPVRGDVLQGQIHLAVSDCGGSSVVINACTSNSGSIVLVGSIVPPVAIWDLVGIEAFIVIEQAGILSDWWRLGPAGCRAGRLTVSSDFTAGPFNCTDLWQGKATGNVSVSYPYAPPPVPPGSPPAPSLPPAAAELLDITCTVSADAPLSLTTDQEHYLFSVNITKAATVGTCAGCNTTTALVLYDVICARPPGVGDIWVFGDGAGQGVCYNGGCYGTPTRASSWGMVKTLYR